MQDIRDGAKDIVLQRLQDEWLFRREDSAKVMFPHTVHYTKEPPARTDDEQVAAGKLTLRSYRVREPWQRLTRQQIVRILADAQASAHGVICAGCGRVLEVEFMQLDHIQPKADGGENVITNRVLLCGPCNRRKRNYLTLSGLHRENKKKAVGWMNDEGRAKLAWDSAREKAEWVRDHFASEACQVLIGAGQPLHR